MNFFEHQDLARSRSRKFVLFYIIAVALICITVAGVAGLIAYFVVDAPIEQRTQPIIFVSGIAAGITALIIAGGSLYRISELRGGGSSVALALGGRQIDSSSQDPDERRVLNVVEEMAIASGVPVPPVYLMPSERGINAFAAGYTPGDAVIGVTKGCITGLNREELQGVMAHEFSHILNGDMRLNIRLIGLLNGIVLISLIGYTLFETTPRTTRGKEGLAVQVGWILSAIILIVIGSLGALTARILQASVSRQREFLADASAVQFTRNPNGIANALRRIGGDSRKARIKHPRAQEAGHMFFGEITRTTSMLRSTLASHPPLELRIKRIDPSWDGTMLMPLISTQDEPKAVAPKTIQDRLGSKFPDLGIGPASVLLPLLALSGTMTPAHIEHARTLITSIPQALRDAAQDPYSGRAVVYALLLDRKDAMVHQAQIQHLSTHGDLKIAQLVEKLSSSASTMKTELRLPLLDMTLGSLARLSNKQHETFRVNVDALIKMDKSIDLFEWVTMGALTRHLDERFGLSKPIVVQYYNLKQLGREVSVLLSMLAYTGAKDEQSAGKAFVMGESSVRGIGAQLLSDKEANMRALDTALKILNQCAPRVKKQLLQASALVVGADREITTNEAELLRAIADTLGVPTPPLLPGQQLI